MNTADVSKLNSFVQSYSKDDDDDEAGAPAGSVYENQSGGVVDVLNNLRDEANQQLDQSRKAENKADNNYQMLKQTLEDAIKFANKEMSEAKKGLAASKESQASAEGDLDVTKKDLAVDTSTLSDLHRECMTRAQDFEVEAKSRSEEMRGLALAKGAIGKIDDGLVVKLRAQFLQVSMKSGPSMSTASSAIHRVRNFARKQKDQVLAQLASRMAFTMDMGSKAGPLADVFAKLKEQMLESIEKIKAEQAADETHKMYCDEQLAETTAKVKSIEAEIEKHTAKIDQKTSSSLRVKAEVANLQKELATMIKEKAEMDALRQKEKADYDANKAETEMSLGQIKFALKVP